MKESQRWFALGLLLALALLIYYLRPILAPFLIGALFAYLGDPLADQLEEKGMRRSPAVALVFLVMTTIMVALVLLLLPVLNSQLLSMLASLPDALQWLQLVALPKVQQLTGLEASVFQLDSIKSAMVDHWQKAGGIAAMLVRELSASGLALVQFLANLVLIPVVVFYLLRDWDIMIGKIRDLFPRHLEPVITQLAKECDEVLSAFLRGQLTIMFALGAMYSIGLWIVGLDFALLLGIVAGLASLIPYMGPIIGIVSASIAAFVQFGEWWPLLGVMLVFGLGQVLEGVWLTPWLVGDRIGLHPVAVIFAIMAGGQLFGFVGVLLALPIAAIIMVLLRHAHDNYLNSDWYGSNVTENTETIPVVDMAELLVEESLDLGPAPKSDDPESSV